LARRDSRDPDAGYASSGSFLLQEVLTAMENRPTLRVAVDGQEIARPTILEIV